MLNAIKYNLGHLTHFAGRDSRATFWYYVLFLLLLDFVINIFIALPIIIGGTRSAFEGAMAGATKEAVEAQVMLRMGSHLAAITWISIATTLLLIALVLAAFVRRLHDSGHSGWWAMIPVAAQLAGVVFAISTLDDMREIFLAAADPARMGDLMAGQAEIARYGFVGWIAPVVVIVFGVMKSTKGPNRYGAEPVRP